MADLTVRYGRSTFGDPTTMEEQQVMEALPTFRRHLVAPDELAQVSKDLGDASQADLALVQAGGRWRPGTYDPDRFEPGDVVALRYYAVSPNLSRMMSILHLWDDASLSDQDRVDLLWHARRLASLARLVQGAASYYLPVHSAQAILASTPPDDELLAGLRLPFDAVNVYFGADLEIPPEFLRWSAHLDTGRAQTAALLERLAGASLADPWTPHLDAEVALARARGSPEPHKSGRDLTTTLRDLGGFLSGVTLLANADGTLADEVIWTVATNLDPALADTAMRYDRMRGMIDGFLPAATLAPLARNLAAAVCWGAWSQPDPPPPLPEAGSRAWRKAWKHGAVRRAERRGAMAGVRVIDLARTAAPKARAVPEPSRPQRKSPIPHPRRGHWRRSRVGPRDAWHYVGHWIPGRMVSLHSGDPSAAHPTVYRLPVPPGTPGAGELDNETEP